MTGPASQVNFMLREGFLTNFGEPYSAEFWLHFYSALDRSPRAKSGPPLNSKHPPRLITPSSPRASKFLHYGNSNSQPKGPTRNPQISNPQTASLIGLRCS